MADQLRQGAGVRGARGQGATVCEADCTIGVVRSLYCVHVRLGLTNWSARRCGVVVVMEAVLAEACL